MTRRRWIADKWTDKNALLIGPQAAHLARVLRAQPGMEFDIVAGDRVHRGMIASISEDAVEFALGEELSSNPALSVTLLLAIYKFDRMEWAIEKTTEVGADRIIPIIARRSEKHLAQAAVTRVERWRRIAREAAQQARRSDVPTIDAPTLLKNAVEIGPGALRLLLTENERAVTLKEEIEAAAQETTRRVHLAIGPEGGWTPEEEALFKENGWKPVTLGPRILRAETAAIAALSVAASLIG